MAKCFQLQEMGCKPLSLFTDFAPKTYTFENSFPEHSKQETIKNIKTSVTYEVPSQT